MAYPFTGGKGFFTASDPMSALQAKPPPTWAAVMPQFLTPEVANAYKQAGVALVVWEPQASQAGVDAVHQYGAAGYIAQAEGPDQLAAAVGIGGQLGNTPRALVTNNFMDAYPPGWIAMPEAYQNNNPNNTPDQMVRSAQARGATEVIPVIGVGFVDTPDGRRMSAAEYQRGLDLAGAAGATGSAAYLSDQMSPEDLNAYTSGRTPSGQVPPDGSGQPKPPPAPAPPPPPPPGHPPPPPGGPTGQLPSPHPTGQDIGVPPPPYAPQGQQMGNNNQFAEGPLGENWNLGWQGTNTAPKTFNPTPGALPQQPGTPQLPAGGGVIPTNPLGAPPAVRQPFPITNLAGSTPSARSLYLDPGAITRFLNLPTMAAPPPPPPYVNPDMPPPMVPYHWGGF